MCALFFLCKRFFQVSTCQRCHSSCLLSCGACVSLFCVMYSRHAASFVFFALLLFLWYSCCVALSFVSIISHSFLFSASSPCLRHSCCAVFPFDFVATTRQFVVFYNFLQIWTERAELVHCSQPYSTMEVGVQIATKLVLTEVASGSAADIAGLCQGDVILFCNTEEPTDPGAFLDQLTDQLLAWESYQRHDHHDHHSGEQDEQPFNKTPATGTGLAGPTDSTNFNNTKTSFITDVPEGPYIQHTVSILVV